MASNETKHRNKFRKTVFFSSLFAVIFSITTAVSYFLAPARTVAYEAPSTSEGNGGQSTTPPTDHLSRLLSALETLPGLSGTLDGDVSFPKSEGSDERSTATIDADVALYLADVKDYAFSLDLEAGLNGSTKTISASYIEGEMAFDLLGAKYYVDETNSQDAIDYLIRIFGEEAFQTPDLLSMIGDLDTSSMLGVFGGIETEATSSYILFDISLNLVEGKTSHVYLTTDTSYVPTELRIENLVYGDLSVNLVGHFSLENDAKATIRTRIPSDYQAAGYRPLADSLGIVERLYSLYQTPRFGLSLEGRLRNEAGAVADDGKDPYSLNFALEGQADLVDGAFDASIDLSGTGENVSRLSLGYRGKSESEDGKAYLSYNEGMNLRMSMLTMDSLLARIEEKMPSVGGNLLDAVLFNDELKAIAAGEYERIIDAVEGFEMVDDNLLRLTIDLSYLGIGNESSLIVTLDGRTAEQGFAGSEATIEASGLSIGGFAADITIKTSPYSSIKDIDFSSYDSLEGLPTIFDQIAGLVETKQAGLLIDGSLLDGEGKESLGLSGRLDVDFGTMLLGSSLSLVENPSSSPRSHSILLDVAEEETEPYLRFVYNEKMKGRMAISTFSDIIDLAMSLLNSDDPRWDAFLDPIRAMMVDTLISDLMDGQLAAIVDYPFLDSLSVDASKIAVTIDMAGLGMDGKLALDINLGTNGEISSLSMDGLDLGGSILSLEISLAAFEESGLNKIASSDGFMDFSSLGGLLETALGTASLGTYHFDDANIELTGFTIFSAAEVNVDAEIRVDGANVEAYVHLGGLRDGIVLPLITEGSLFSSRDTYIYYDGRDGRSDLYIDNHEHGGLAGNKHTYYKHTSEDFMANPVPILIKEIFSFSDSIYDAIAGGGNADPTGEPIAYEDILKAYSYDEARESYAFTIGVATLLQSSILSDLEVSIGTAEVGAYRFLSTIDASINIADVFVARLTGSLSDIDNDRFWVDSGNAFNSYLSAHSGDSYTLIG